MTDFRINYIETQPVLTEGIKFWFNFIFTDTVSKQTPFWRVNYLELEGVANQPLNWWVNYVELQPTVYDPLHWQLNYVEVQAVEVFREPWNMSTEKFPEMRGLQWDIKRRPLFSTQVNEHISGRETRYSFWQNPKWEFEMSYDYLPDDRSSGDSDLQTLIGFYLARRGKYDTFLYKFGQDYRVVNSLIGTGTGSLAEFTFVREYGGYTEELPYVEFTTPAPVIWFDGTQSETISSQIATFDPNIVSIASVVIGGDTLTPVVSAPGPNQYTVNMVTGEFGFNISREGATVTVDYRRPVNSADYTLTAPNTVIFDSSPSNGTEIYASFDFYYIVRFKEDELDPNVFMDKLWELEELTLISVIE